MSARLPPQEHTSLQPALAQLEALGAGRFDPVRFRYITTMARRSAELDGAVADIVANRAMLALQDYQNALSREREEAQALLERLTAARPELRERALALFDAFAFKALQRLAAERPRRHTPGALSGLLDRLEGSDRASGSEADSGAIGELLRQQEAEAVSAVAADATGLAAGGPGELRAARYFRDARRQRNAAKRVSREVLAAPQDSGPLNPQKLAIRSLLAMGNLSPAYLGRFVASVETLLWLEKAGETGKS
ncbi:MAG: DUF2894 domain-containing protein [Halieaceae bacterium]|nr:DUF2894 domain-containing protein [Halieaceae bacterium]